MQQQPQQQQQKDRYEIKLGEGIYFTPSRAASAAQGVHDEQSGQASAAATMQKPVFLLTQDELLAERVELQMQLERLADSNTQMREFDPHGQDALLVESIAENIDAMARKAARLDAILERLGVPAAQAQAFSSGAHTGGVFL
ncbi:hypothetical protein FVE85_8180 [Porphyridium purpureum]|uniref:Uncharacterized protein n=1 Tax=Porphyridium purpureum TaxID=35688 RepID=A0A5J4YPN2_PORPP|nr:hypothetical protein FVE85_8180 [Porphyridium purpureum]|eukprot:POR5913..scf295_9